jgi:toxin ParE1/3/4
MHGFVLEDVRKAVVSGFPYCVYYREVEGSVVILSVFHTSRDPKEWQERV